ncbi:hypothetical protein OKW96_01370 [Sphingobacterium sp. KU25419]|nr:hypothetical protein OKW96_01370 [Sphingobacterium sp. KU25419]
MITKESIQNKFKSIFQEEPIIVRSPGRINIIGEHTDYNDGFVLPAAIDKAVYIAVSKRNDDLISLYAEDYKATYEVELNRIAPSDLQWPNYILGVVDQIQKRGLNVGDLIFILMVMYLWEQDYLLLQLLSVQQHWP